MATRQTTFKFYSNVNLSPRTNDTFYFDSVSAQATYFATKLSYTVNNCYYQRAGKSFVKVPLSYSNLYKCDYLSFFNDDYEEKVFYAFINDVEYVDDSTTIVYYTIDLFQTWFFQCSIHPCYVERNHSNRDDYGENFLPDNLECGDLITASISDNQTLYNHMCVVVVATFDVVQWMTQTGNPKNPPSTWYKNGVYDQLSQAAFICESGSSHASTGSALQIFLNMVFDGVGGVTMDDIINIYIYPRIGLSLSGTVVPDATQGESGSVFRNVYDVAGVDTSEDVLLPSLPTTIDGYTPKNKKLLQYPYTLIHISNNDGSAIDLKFERFYNPNPSTTTPWTLQRKVHVCGTTCGEAKLRLVPLQYMGLTSTTVQDYEYGIDSGSFPTVSMTGDAYQIYLAQNKNRIENGYNMFLFNSGMKIAGGAASDIKTIASVYGGGAMGGSEGAAQAALSGAKKSGGIMGAALDTATNVFKETQSLQAQFSDLKIAPGTSSGLSGVGITYQNDKRFFRISVKTLDQQHARIVDDYYTMFGYPVRRITTPMVKARTKFTYVKTVGCILTGNVPEAAKAYIESLFDNGIRLWYSPSDIGDFNVINNPINS